MNNEKKRRRTLLLNIFVFDFKFEFNWIDELVYFLKKILEIFFFILCDNFIFIDIIEIITINILKKFNILMIYDEQFACPPVFSTCRPLLTPNTCLSLNVSQLNLAYNHETNHANLKQHRYCQY